MCGHCIIARLIGHETAGTGNDIFPLGLYAQEQIFVLFNKYCLSFANCLLVTHHFILLLLMAS